VKILRVFQRTISRRDAMEYDEEVDEEEDDNKDESEDSEGVSEDDIKDGYGC
jgi:hypothetical protein